MLSTDSFSITHTPPFSQSLITKFLTLTSLCPPTSPHSFLSSLQSQAVESLFIFSLSAIPSTSCPQPRHIRFLVWSPLNTGPCLYSASLCDSPHLQLPRNPRVPPAQLLPASPPPAPPPGRLAEEGEPLSPPQLPTAAAAASAALPGPTSRPSALTLPDRGALQRHPYSFLGVRDA